MLAYKNDILQFVYSDNDDISEHETKYSFGFCNDDIEHQHDTVTIRTSNTRISRNFERFNVVMSTDNELESSIISPETMETEYINRPRSTLVEVNDED